MITAQNDLTIDAVTKKSQQVSAEGMAYQDGWAAAGVAYSESHGASDVTVGGTIKGSTVNIGSEIRAVKNASSAKTTVGTGLFDRPHVWAGNKILDGLSKWITKIPAQTHAQSNTKLAMSGAVSYSEHSNRANVKVLNNYGSGQTAADAGTTSVSGDKVTISAHVLDMISNSAGASVSPKTKKRRSFRRIRIRKTLLPARSATAFMTMTVTRRSAAVQPSTLRRLLTSFLPAKRRSAGPIHRFLMFLII